MIEVYTGVPGSGKTYRAVDTLYNAFIDEKSTTFGKFDLFYTNINEFDYSAFPEGVANTIDFEKLLVSLTELRDLYKKNVGDTVLLTRASELSLDKALFIIDEAHNYFDVKNDVLIWWLSYHRHLHQDVILISQNMTLIFGKYLTFSEFFYVATPSALRLSGSTFTYTQYVDKRLYNKHKTASVKVKFNEEVFKLYKSGANTQGNKVIVKFLTYFAILASVGALIFFGISKYYAKDENATSPTAVSYGENINTPTDTFTVVCVDFDCSYNGHSFSVPQLDSYIKQYQLIPVKSSVLNGDITLRTFGTNEKLLKDVFNVTLSPTSSD